MIGRLLHCAGAAFSHFHVFNHESKKIFKFTSHRTVTGSLRSDQTDYRYRKDHQAEMVRDAVDAALEKQKKDDENGFDKNRKGNEYTVNPSD